MTLAGYDLKSTDMKVIDISYKYGYNSPTSFTKAFQQFHGISPKEAREKDIKLCVMPKMQIAQKQQYTWKIEKKEPLRLIGKCIKISCVNNEHYKKIPEFWSECQKNGIYSTLVSLDAGHVEIEIPEATWAIFDCIGTVPKAVQKGWKYLNEEWLVKYPFKHAPCPELEWYSDSNVYSEDYLSQIWIPILEEER